MKILVTGAAGFIGSALVVRLLDKGNTIIGIDNHNNYYDQNLKENRILRYLEHPKYTHLKVDIADRTCIENIFKKYQPDCVVNMAAQAGVRYSIENPMAYIDSNVVGFANILEGCRTQKIQHLVYASSSSVYGGNTQLPFSTNQNVDHPLSLYAATKKSNELMAHSYSHLYGVPTTGLRFFTVYGPWGRPDMALFKFTKAILSGESIKVFNYGNHHRDFTYIDDIVEGIVRVIDRPAEPNNKWSGLAPSPSSSSAPWRIYNIGNNNSITLMNYIKALELSLDTKAVIEFLPLQLGDVPDTQADVEDFVNAFGYKPNITVEKGVANFVNWYREYYKV